MHQKINSSRPPPVPRGAGLQPLSLPPLNYVADISIILGQNNQEMSVQLSTTIRDSTQLIMSYKLSYDVTNHYRRIFCVMEVYHKQIHTGAKQFITLSIFMGGSLHEKEFTTSSSLITHKNVIQEKSHSNVTCVKKDLLNLVK